MANLIKPPQTLGYLDQKVFHGNYMPMLQLG
jgi:hypothetical protein